MCYKTLISSIFNWSFQAHSGTQKGTCIRKMVTGTFMLTVCIRELRFFLLMLESGRAEIWTKASQRSLYYSLNTPTTTTRHQNHTALGTSPTCGTM